MKRREATMERGFFRVFWALTVFSLLALGSVEPSQGRLIPDMSGRTVSVPDFPRRVYGASPPVTYMLYCLDPSMIAGLNFPVRPWEKRYLRKDMQNLPVLGGWFGQGAVPNLEMILNVHPEIVIFSAHDSAMKKKVDETMKRVPMPVIPVSLDRLVDYPDAFSYLGRVLGRKVRGDELASHARKALSRLSALAASIPAGQRVSVYYAEGVDGLSTECHSSLHAELIPLVGGRNVHRCRSSNPMGMEKVNFEQVLLYNPEVILVMEDVFYRKIFSDPLWRRIKAVKNQRVYLIPREPFNWFDRPPSFMRLLGGKWVASLLYPTRYQIDMIKETQEFFRIFLKVSLTAQEAEALIYRRQ
jgi:iron complex transport system substrate-binding protein